MERIDVGEFMEQEQLDQLCDNFAAKRGDRGHTEYELEKIIQWGHITCAQATMWDLLMDDKLNIDFCDGDIVLHNPDI
jgi:hypothetical protein